MQPKDIVQKKCNFKLNLPIESLIQDKNSYSRKKKKIETERDNLCDSKEFTYIPNKRKPFENLFKRFSRFISSKKTLIGLFFMISITYHFMFIESIYHLARNKEMKMHMAKPAVFKIKPLKEYQLTKKVSPSKPAPTVKKKISVKPGKTKIKALSPTQLYALGKKHMSSVREGTFPALTLSYNDPFSYVRQMYNLGSKTVVYDMSSREYYEIELFNGDILPLNSSDFIGFSFFKRVMDDSQWNKQKIRAAARLNTSPESLEILLLVPMSVETRWTGHQANVFRQMNIKISNIAAVEAQFQESKLKIVRIHLKDGTSKMVNDMFGI